MWLKKDFILIIPVHINCSLVVHDGICASAWMGYFLGGQLYLVMRFLAEVWYLSLVGEKNICNEGDRIYALNLDMGLLSCDLFYSRKTYVLFFHLQH